jgi:hypothetical protein
MAHPKRRTRKEMYPESAGGTQCKECRLVYCKKMRACAYYECLAIGEGTVYECPDREEGNYFKMVGG